jgi:hypothetical protein
MHYFQRLCVLVLVAYKGISSSVWVMQYFQNVCAGTDKSGMRGSPHGTIYGLSGTIGSRGYGSEVSFGNKGK